MRGKENLAGRDCKGAGITPAYAGKSAWRGLPCIWHGDHPRVCGEKTSRNCQFASRMGSPPRMRGKVVECDLNRSQGGITPAYAGKSTACFTASYPSQDHPRVCGEKGFRGPKIGEGQGSPPRMRGKGPPYLTTNVAKGITPAYAGKSPARSSAPGRWRDHPRVCGEKQCRRCNAAFQWGSPPRMRGKVSDSLPARCADGITPAYAGKRLKRSRSTVPPVAIVPLFPSVCNKPVVSDGSPAGRDAPLFLPAENAVPASPAYNLRSL